MQVILRDYNRETDDPFIYSTWTKNEWYSTHKEKEIKKDWFQAKIKEIKNYLDNDQTAIACLRSDEDAILGYIVIKNNKPVFFYVKKDYRHSKIEELLLNQIKGESDGRNKHESTAEAS